jgi:hypothetical protein
VESPDEEQEEDGPIITGATSRRGYLGGAENTSPKKMAKEIAA